MNPELNPELIPFLQQWGEKQATMPAGATPAEQRRHFESIAVAMRLPTPPDVDTNQEHWIDNPAGAVRVRVFRYRSEEVQPCLIYMHGGAWMRGSPETHWDVTARIAAFNQQTVISVDYAKAPDFPFPTALNQCNAVVHWALKNAADLRIKPDAIAVGGDSAGGNLAAALAIDMREQGINLNGQLLFYPCCDFDQSRPSYTENAEAPMLQTRRMAAVNAMYCPNPDDLQNPRAAPLLADDHSGLPPAYIAVSQYDPLRDSGLAYAQVLTAAGIEVAVDSGEGLVHGYLRALDYCGACRQSLSDAAVWLKNLNNRS